MIAALGMVFLLPAVAIDLAYPFPRDTNALFPWALAFYPAVGFLAEVVFHLVPLALVTIAIGCKQLPLWAWIPAVLAEPAYQAATSGGPTPQGVLVALHVAAFSAVQLWAFQRHGFVAMYALRIVYYLFWHVAWGAARLGLLFP